jgi:hypothetical protein
VGLRLTRFLQKHLVSTEDERTASLVRELRHVRRSGQFSKPEFLAMCRWKSPRAIGRCQANSAQLIREVSRRVFLTKAEAQRLELLTSLAGVGIPTASAILTLTDPRRYGVIDIRAWQELYRLGAVQDRAGGQGFRTEHWLQYLGILRQQARALGASVRQVEYSLFAFHQLRHEGPLYPILQR